MNKSEKPHRGSSTVGLQTQSDNSLVKTQNIKLLIWNSLMGFYQDRRHVSTTTTPTTHSLDKIIKASAPKSVA